MEHQLHLSELLKLALLLGAPVFSCFIVLGLLILRTKARLSWLALGLSAPAWLSLAVAGQLGVWLTLDLPEHWFMALGFINVPALISCLLLSAPVVLWVLLRRKPPNNSFKGMPLRGTP